MVPYLPFERTWAEAILVATVPAGERHPGLGAVSLDRFWDVFGQSAPFLMKIGFRVAIWFVALQPIWSLSGWRTFAGSSPEDRQQSLQALNSSHRAMTEQLLSLIKLMACFAYFEDAAIQDRFRSAGRK